VSFATTTADILTQLQDIVAIAQRIHSEEEKKKRQPYNIQTGDCRMINT
jgi:hypothetical protein